MKKSIKDIAKDFRAEKVEEKLMAAHNIPKTEKQQQQELDLEKKQRDQLTLCRQRCVILTHETFYKKQDEKKALLEAAEAKRLQLKKEKKSRKFAEKKQKK